MTSNKFPKIYQMKSLATAVLVCAFVALSASEGFAKRGTPKVKSKAATKVRQVICECFVNDNSRGSTNAFKTTSSKHATWQSIARPKCIKKFGINAKPGSCDTVE